MGLKFPKKVDGATFNYEGYDLTCKPTGKSYNGVATLAWYHKNGEQAMRSVNGKITFIEPSETAENNTKELPKVSPQIVEKYDTKEQEEEYVYQRAWNIAKRRHPSMDDKLDVFGMIVNSIVTRLISL